MIKLAANLEDLITNKNLLDPKSIIRDEEYDLKKQYLGPSFKNMQRLYEVGDSALFQAGYAIPSAGLGAIIAGPLGAAAGFGIGGKLGAGHAWALEAARLAAAKDKFVKNEKLLLSKLDKSFNNWGAWSAVLGGLGGAGLGLATTQKEPAINQAIAAGILGLGGAGLVGLLGGLTGRGLERERLRKSKLKNTIEKYD